LTFVKNIINFLFSYGKIEFISMQN